MFFRLNYDKIILRFLKKMNLCFEFLNITQYRIQYIYEQISTVIESAATFEILVENKSH